jgi:hypothetical protein
MRWSVPFSLGEFLVEGPLLARFEPLRVRLGRTLLPGLEIRHEHPLEAISKRPTDA